MHKYPPKISTVESGQQGESYVCAKITAAGYKIIDRNIREKFAEIDIVAEDGETLCFIEVRTRTDKRLGHPAETITPKKQRSIRRAAEAYIAKNNIPPRPMRFDVATVIWSTMQYEYFENAFF